MTHSALSRTWLPASSAAKATGSWWKFSYFLRFFFNFRFDKTKHKVRAEFSCPLCSCLVLSIFSHVGHHLIHLRTITSVVKLLLEQTQGG